MSAVDLVEIHDRWLRQCGACDAGLSMSCTCPEGDPRNVISNLADEVLRLRLQIAAAEDERTLTWSLPAEPGPEVTAVRDAEGTRWERKHWPYHPDGSQAEPGTSWCWESAQGRKRWAAVLTYGPVTDASAEVTP